uniref:DUF475 domain-containing protein n=1 Tax=Paulinella micropora TaxID=1928728 RepID=A0A385I1D4_9EUKA|nr:hypothetical protein PMNZ_832 [Paulinella micropora]AXY63747.1 hypothetical protein PMNZ_832 [Paulinella micropora]
MKTQMKVYSILSTIPSFHDTNQWSEVLWLLPILVILELVLSADNAIALAAIARQLEDPAQQRYALNLGLTLAIGLRFCLIVAARWVLLFWPLQLGAALYLLWLCARHFLIDHNELEEVSSKVNHSFTLPPLWNTVITLGLTDLAFSLDSVAAAIAVSDRLAIVMAGGIIGVVGLRFTAGLFIRYLSIYVNLETAGYLAVGFVGLRLLLRLSIPSMVIPEWYLVAIVLILFIWGFSKRFDIINDENKYLEDQ